MCKEILVISVNRVVDTKRIIGKNGGPKREAQGVADPLRRTFSLYIGFSVIGFGDSFPSEKKLIKLVDLI
jgi:hypothetical protein